MDFSSVVDLAVGGVATIGSAATGGLLGIVGGVATGLLSFFKTKSEQKFVLDKMAADRDMVRLEAESAVKIAEAQRAAVAEQQDGEAFVASQHMANQTLITPGLAAKAPAWVVSVVYCVESILRIFRPAITVWVLYQFSDLVNTAQNAVKAKGYMTHALAEKILLMSMDATIVLTMAVLGWWFAQRELQKRLGTLA